MKKPNIDYFGEFINFSRSIIHNRSLYTTRQLWKVQESPDDMPPGQTPHSVTMQCFDSLVDAAQPGDRVTITGIFRAQQVRYAPRARAVKTVCRTFVDVVHCMKATKGKLHEKRREAQDDHLVSIAETAQKSFKNEKKNTHTQIIRKSSKI